MVDTLDPRLEATRIGRIRPARNPSSKMRFLCLHGSGTNSRVRIENPSTSIVSFRELMRHRSLRRRQVRSHSWTTPYAPLFPAGSSSGSSSGAEADSGVVAALRYELGDDHEYEFVQGTLVQPMAPGWYPPASLPRSLWGACIPLHTLELLTARASPAAAAPSEQTTERRSLGPGLFAAQ